LVVACDGRAYIKPKGWEGNVQEEENKIVA
jgi:hypothetical protein